MAGSYRHAVDDQGRLFAPRHIGIAAENLGDDPARVEEARQRYQDGLAMSPGIGSTDVDSDD